MGIYWSLTFIGRLRFKQPFQQTEIAPFEGGGFPLFVFGLVLPISVSSSWIPRSMYEGQGQGQ